VVDSLNTNISSSNRRIINEFGSTITASLQDRSPYVFTRVFPGKSEVKGRIKFQINIHKACQYWILSIKDQSFAVSRRRPPTS
jgi:hypothetical protein